ncbi:MAG: sigma-70 family RNA polymerase sigma factor [Actinobacteria bacterium]|nr:sigma-70 family RNA polymerase sigma factor [Actinomycetota bacterium]
MTFRGDPLADIEPLIRRVYAYVAYRIGSGPDADDVTSDVFERAFRYRKTYDPRRGDPAAWLIGIARRCIQDSLAGRTPLEAEPTEQPDPDDLEEAAVRRLMLAPAVAKMRVSERELIALRFGADLTAQQIGELLEMRTNAVEVALHRALARLRELLGANPDTDATTVFPTVDEEFR